MNVEKRKYKRFFFPKENKISIQLWSTDHEENIIKARLLDISEGGIGIVINRNHNFDIPKGSEFIIRNLSGMDSLKSLCNINVKIKWVLDYKPLGNIGIGCAFENLDNDCKEDIFRLMF